MQSASILIKVKSILRHKTDFLFFLKKKLFFFLKKKYHIESQSEIFCTRGDQSINCTNCLYGTNTAVHKAEQRSRNGARSVGPWV
jgi:hypothetical protein